MDNNGNGQPAVRDIPTCATCHQELIQFREKVITFQNGLVGHMFWCPNPECRALQCLQIVGMAQKEQRIISPGTGPTLIKQ